MWNFISWAIFGLVAGAIAKLIYPGTQGGGMLATIGLGVVGAFVGGLLYSFITTGKVALVASNSFALIPFVCAVLGAMITIFIWGLVTQNA
jgi:uncharacterized membrane protein YeaQ/YmgE (transglycosylase-associated protein family)